MEQKEVYDYDKKGQLLSKLDKDGYLTKYVYTKQGDLSEIQYADGRAVSYTYGKGGERRSLTYPDGKTVFYGYDEQLRLSELKEGDSIITYGYDPLGRLSEIQKDGQTQTQYGYDAFGNRTWKEEAGERTTYRHNALNQLLSETHDGRQTQYGYDRRGNLTSIVENGKCQKQYIYGALNRLEEAVNSVGKVARYQYNGLGHRVGKQEGLLPEEKIQKLDPQKRVEIEVGNFTQIQYTLDLTRQYHNLLERTEEERTQTYFWDGNVASYEENGETNYYLQDELGSPLRIADGEGAIRESYGYGAFGEDLYGNQGNLQPFGYTGYQRDQIAETYYAQAREYLTENGRFAGQDLIAGFMDMPFSMNRYSYCFNTPMLLVDLDGAWPSWSDIKKGFSKGIGKAWNWVKKHKVLTTIGAIAVIGGLSVLTGGIAGGVVATTLSQIAWGATGGAVIGGISSWLVGGDFANGFVGGAISGGIVGGVGTFAELLKSSLLGIGGNLFAGATGSTVTLYLDDGNISGDDLIEIIMSGGLQAISGTTLGKLFSNAKTDVDKVGKAILNYFESVYDIGGGIGLEALLKIICKDDENQKKSQVLSNCGI